MHPVLPSSVAETSAAMVRAALGTAERQELLARHARVLARKKMASQSIGDQEYVVQDVVQETHSRALKQAATYNPGSGDVGAWLHGILVNVVRETARSHKRLPLQAPDDPVVWDKLASKIAAREDSVDDRDQIHIYLAQLSADERAVIEMRIFQDAEYETIGRHHGITASTARVRYCRAIQSLKLIASVSPREGME